MPNVDSIDELGREDPQLDTIVASLPFSEETVSLVADRIVNTYRGKTSDYESTPHDHRNNRFRQKVVTARERTPHSTQRKANYGARH